MLIKQITVKDFRQYKSSQKLVFSMDKDKNVSVILGVNTSGKTTLIEAFKWCLYGETSYNKSDLINAQTKREIGYNSDVDVFVEIVLIHNNTEYIVRRTRKFTKLGMDKVNSGQDSLKLSYKEKSGELISVRKEECQELIDSILPKGLADYFFFDGERIGDIGKKSDVKKSVQGLMGLDAITAARDRLDPNRKNSVTSEFGKDLDLGFSQENLKIQKKIDDTQEELVKSKLDLEKIKEDIDNYEDIRADLTAKILANKETKEKQEEILKLESTLNTVERNIDDSYKLIINDFSTDAFNFFAIPLVDRALEVLDSTEKDNKGLDGMESKAIDAILKRGVCVCGREAKSKEVLEELERERKLLPPYHIGTVVRQTEKDFYSLKEKGKDYPEKLNSIYDTYRRNKDLYDEKKKELENLRMEIKSNIDVGKVEEDRRAIENDISRSEGKRDSLNKLIGSLESKLESIKEERKSKAKTEEKNKNTQICIDYCEELYKIFDEAYLKHEKEIKNSLEEKINTIFEKMYHGNRKVSIDDNYMVRLSTELDGSMIKTDESKGLEAVKNFSFVSGLVALAKEKAVEAKDELGRVEEPYPLVMDAPFSNVDEKHIENITNILPEVAEQVILILMEKDWNYAKTSLDHRLGAIYEIEKVKNQETHSILKERS